MRTKHLLLIVLAMSMLVVGCSKAEPEAAKDAPSASAQEGSKAGGMLGENPDAAKVEFGSKK